MTNKFAEPWKVVANKVLDSNGIHICTFLPCDRNEIDRMVKCVNACAEVDDPVVMEEREIDLLVGVVGQVVYEHPEWNLAKKAMELLDSKR